MGGRRAGADEEVLAVEALRDREEPPGQADHDVPVGVGLVRLQEEHLDPGEDQEGPEDVDDPGEALDELGAHRDHGAAHQQGAHDAPEEDAVLVERRDREEAEEHRDHEDVVDGQGLLDEVAGDVLDGGAGAVVVDGAHPLDRLGSERHHVGGQPEPEPVVLVARVDEAGEGEAEGDPEGGPAEGLLDRDDVGLAVEDAQVEGQEGEHEGDETDVHPDHPHSIGIRPWLFQRRCLYDPRCDEVVARPPASRRPSSGRHAREDDDGSWSRGADPGGGDGGRRPRPALMPWPSSIEMGPGELAVGPGFRIAVVGEGRADRRTRGEAARGAAGEADGARPALAGRGRGEGDPRDPVRRAGERAPAPRDGRELHAHGDGPRARCCRRPSRGASCAAWRRSCSSSGPARPARSASPRSSSGTGPAFPGAA